MIRVRGADMAHEPGAFKVNLPFAVLMAAEIDAKG
jgi:hypothetical protein